MTTTSSLRIAVRLIKATALAMFALGMALAWIAPEATDTLDTAPPEHHTAPTWATSPDAHLPGCAPIHAPRTWIPGHIVTVDRQGVARLWAYNDHTQAIIDAEWDNDDPTDDDYAVGACR